MCPTIVEDDRFDKEKYENFNVQDLNTSKDKITSLMWDLGQLTARMLLDSSETDDIERINTIIKESNNVNMAVRAKLDRDNIIDTLEDEIIYNEGVSSG
jgi:hypothetical protein